jgi:hypothetical protein
MKRTFAIAVAAAVVVAGVLTATGSGQAPPGGRTITLKEVNRGATFKFVDLPPRARNPRRPTFSSGDLFVITLPLTTDTGQAAGRGNIRCTVTRPARTADNSQVLCDAGFVTTNGTLFLSALTRFGDQPTTTGAVTGGTGTYAGARGTFVSTSTSSGSNDTFTLLP